MKQNILKVMVGTVILEAILICLFILIGSFNDLAWRSISSVALVFLYAIPCLLYARIYDVKKYQPIFIIGTIIVLTSALFGIFTIWDLIDYNEILTKTHATLNVIITTLAIISWVLSVITTNNLLSQFKKASILLLTILTGFITIIIWDDNLISGFVSRLFYVVMVLTICSLVCILILKNIYKKDNQIKPIN
jgi:hypothetical protein